MSPKQLKAIAMGLAVLLLLWGASELFSRGSDTVTGSFALPALNQGDADTIALVKGTDSVVLAKQGLHVLGKLAVHLRFGARDLLLASALRDEPHVDEKFAQIFGHGITASAGSPRPAFRTRR